MLAESITRRTAAVHPHMRGDNISPIIPSIRSIGSPPHAWGQFHVPQNQENVWRFTPTCVGTMSAFSIVLANAPVHPHMRGDNLSLKRRNGGGSGSPPHAWGQFVTVKMLLCPRRFTPTCVGTIPCLFLKNGMDSVHPHMRGDNT